MFGSPSVHLSYNARLRRARIAFDAGECFKYRQPPLKLLLKLQQRFEEDKEDGYIEAYALFTQRLKELWQHVRSQEGRINPQHKIRMTIGQGGRIYSEIRLYPSEKEGVVLLSCDFGDRRVPVIPFNAFVFNVIRGLEELKIKARLDRAQLRFLYLLLQNGQKLNRIPLKAAPLAEGAALLIQLDEQQNYVTLHLFDHRWLKNAENREAIWKKAVRELNRQNRKHLRLKLLKEHSLEKLASLASKMQGTGFNMPYDILIAYDMNYQFDVAQVNEEKKLAQDTPEDLYSWRSGSQRKSQYFQVSISADGMSAHLKAANIKALHKLQDRGGLHRPWLLQELAKLGIVHGTEAYEENLLTAIKDKKNIVDLPLALGTPSIQGHAPFLYYFAGQRTSDAQKFQDVRETQNARLVKRGQLLGEIRYSGGQPAISVRGQKLHVKGTVKEGDWRAGEGVRLEDDSTFYALRDGILSEEGGVLSIEEAYIHEGSINLSSGNLAFEGAVIVKGDIEAGATVRVRGHLLVEGMIAHANIRVKGNLEVKGGIITGPQGRVEVDGDLSCNFIEYSEIQVSGQLIVKSSLINSHVVAGGAVILKDSSKGTIAGGMISSCEGIRTAILGNPQGSATECRIGSNFASAVRLRRARSWLVRLTDLYKGIETGLDRGATAKEVDPESAKQRLKKIERLLDLIRKKCEYLEHHMKWNPDSLLYASRLLDKNSVLIAAGQRVPLTVSLKSAFVTGYAFHGSHLLDPSELRAFQAEHPAVNFEFKKAG